MDREPDHADSSLCDGPPQSIKWNRNKRSGWRMWGTVTAASEDDSHDVDLARGPASRRDQRQNFGKYRGYPRLVGETGASQILRRVAAIAIVISAIDNSGRFGNVLIPQR